MSPVYSTKKVVKKLKRNWKEIEKLFFFGKKNALIETTLTRESKYLLFQVIQSQNQSQVTSQQQQQQQQGGGQPDCRSEATSVCGDNSSVLSGFSSGPVNQQAGHQAGGNGLPPGSSASTMTSASKVESVQEMFFELGMKSHTVFFANSFHGNYSFLNLEIVEN
jgi:hypothetical protein